MSLPSGWAEHVAPTGHKYYYNSVTHESTYTRPAVKKEKAKAKTEIPGTDWLRVVTTEGNVFYRHKTEQRSVWTVPPEIQDAVTALEQEEMERAKAQPQPPNKADEEEEREIARVKAAVSTSIKRKAATESSERTVSKKPRTSEQGGGDDESDESEPEEEWQRAAAEQLAKEAEEEDQRRQEEKQQRAEREQAEKEAAKRVQDLNLSPEESKAIFKTLLREKDINPLHPWDKSLPLFVSDPRCLILSSVNVRRDAFDEYCRERVRELRNNAVQKQVEADPKAQFTGLLEAQVHSTRTSWTEFRRAWKKDRRFYGFGRDDREREKCFKDFIRQLGEKKKAAALKAEADFFLLLKQKGNVQPTSLWKDVKRKLYDDPRYDAVGSSSLREELFNTFLKVDSAAQSQSPEARQSPQEFTTANAEHSLSKQDRKDRAVREREGKVQAERNRIQTSIDKSKMGLDLEEGERNFRVLLVDAIRDPQASWESARIQLEKDVRFQKSPLPRNQQLHLFHSHIDHLRRKYHDQLLDLFESHSPHLDASFKSLPINELLEALPSTKLGLNESVLRQHFGQWQSEREQKAKDAFMEMLNENSFVEFWGRLSKIGGEGTRSGEGDEGDDEAMGTVDMKELAKKVNVEEVVRVISNDRRYQVFDHMPEQREQWIRAYLSGLSAPKLSVHVAGNG